MREGREIGKESVEERVEREERDGGGESRRE